MLGYVMLRAKEDKKIQDRDGIYIYKKGRIYVGKFVHGDVRVYDEKDNAYCFEFRHSCFRTSPRYSSFFDLLKQNEAVNGKVFYMIRKRLRKLYKEDM